MYIVAGITTRRVSEELSALEIPGLSFGLGSNSATSKRASEGYCCWSLALLHNRQFGNHPVSNQDLPRLPRRASDAHKGSFGHALLIGGATGMTGAIALAGMACLRSGAGLVTLGIPQYSQAIVASMNPNYMTLPLPCDVDGRLTSAAESRIRSRIEQATCVAIGPGLGRSVGSDTIVANLFKKFDGPLIVDADGLNALSESRIWLQLVHCETEPSQSLRILTPHPGEWERLSGVSAKDRDGQCAAALSLSARSKCIVLLKGHRTLITDGVDSHFNLTGNASMAVGGSGDCLTGIIMAMICQGMNGIDATRLAAHLHGIAGDLAHAELETPSTLATDLVHFLPAAFRRMA